MNTPTIFQLGKLSNVIKEINDGIGSSWTYISFGENSDLNISLTLPYLQNDIEEINRTVEKIQNYFGLSKNDFKAAVETGYEKIKVVLSGVDQELTISVSNR